MYTSSCPVHQTENPLYYCIHSHAFVAKFPRMMTISLLSPQMSNRAPKMVALTPMIKFTLVSCFCIITSSKGISYEWMAPKNYYGANQCTLSARSDFSKEMLAQEKNIYGLVKFQRSGYFCSAIFHLPIGTINFGNTFCRFACNVSPFRANISL